MANYDGGDNHCSCRFVSMAEKGPQAMNDKPKRGFWRLHLATIILLIHVIGFFIWLSFPSRSKESFNGQHGCFQFGWPEALLVWQNPDDEKWDWSNHNFSIEADGSDNYWIAGLLDLIVPASITLNILFVSEIIIRRRETDKPVESSSKRFWQIHLSTGVAIMVLAAGLLYLNCYQHRRTDYLPFHSHYDSYGWPCLVYGRLYEWGNKDVIEPYGDENNETATMRPVNDTELVQVGWSWKNASMNALVCFDLLFWAAILFEYLVRRREGRAY